MASPTNKYSPILSTIPKKNPKRKTETIIMSSTLVKSVMIE